MNTVLQSVLFVSITAQKPLWRLKLRQNTIVNKYTRNISDVAAKTTAFPKVAKIEISFLIGVLSCRVDTSPTYIQRHVVGRKT